MPIKMRMQNKGFTLLEVVISAVILLIGFLGATTLILWTRANLKSEDKKSQALNVATIKMEEYLAQSYTGLGTRVSPDALNSPVPQALGWQISGELLREEGGNNNFNWTGVITQQYHFGTINIPYKQIEVTSKYIEQDPEGKMADTKKEIRLVNFVPYPYMHAEAINIQADDLDPVPEVPYTSDGSYQPVGPASALNINVRYETDQDILVFYNIAVSIAEESGIKAADTIQTAIFIDGAGPKDLKTETPILTQPLINNVTAFTGAARLRASQLGHMIEVRWRKGTAEGRIELREANLIIIATENLSTI